MALAIDLAARAAEAGEVPVGAVLYETATGAILAQGANTREARRSPLGHAELAVLERAALIRGDWRFNDCTLVVTLEPCPMCAGAILNARVGRVVFGTPDPKAGAVRSLLRLCDDPRYNHRATIIPGVRREQCATQLSAFFKALRARRAT
jgi:tRNA(adenine34) deaminase